MVLVRVSVCLQVSRLMGMGPEENVADQIAGKLEDMLAVVRKVRVRGPSGKCHAAPGVHALVCSAAMQATQLYGLPLCRLNGQACSLCRVLHM